MSDHDAGKIKAIVTRVNKIQDRLPRHRIQPRGRLIDEHDLRFLDQGAGNRRSPHHSALIWDGNLSPDSVRPTCSSSYITFSLISFSWSLVFSFRGKQHCQNSHRIEQSTALEKETEPAPELMQFRSPERIYIRPSTRTLPRSGLISPATCFKRTLLPYPLSRSERRLPLCPLRGNPLENFGPIKGLVNFFDLKHFV